MIVRSVPDSIFSPLGLRRARLFTQPLDAVVCGSNNSHRLSALPSQPLRARDLVGRPSCFEMTIDEHDASTDLPQCAGRHVVGSEVLD